MLNPDWKKQPSEKDLRWFGAILGGALLTLGLLLYLKTGSRAILSAGVAGGVLLPLVYYSVPPLQKGIFLGWIRLTFPIGWLLSQLALLVVFYLLFTPIGLVMRCLREDPMQRRFDRRLTSYWRPYRRPFQPQNYFKQH